MNKKSVFFRTTYDITFCILAIIAVFLSIYDIRAGCKPWQLIVDEIITIIFIIDYFVRLFISKDKKEFFRKNVLDLIAIIPFTSMFKIFRVLKIFRFAKIAKVLKLARLGAYFGRLYDRVRFFFELNGLKYMVFASAVCILIGGVSIHFAEGMSISDGIWWSFVTATTVGYGDISPSSLVGRIIASVLMIVGIGLIGSLTSTITALFFQKKKKSSGSAEEQLIATIQTQLDDFDSLSDSDIEAICNTLHALHNK